MKAKVKAISNKRPEDSPTIFLEAETPEEEAILGSLFSYANKETYAMMGAKHDNGKDDPIITTSSFFVTFREKEFGQE